MKHTVVAEKQSKENVTDPAIIRQITDRQTVAILKSTIPAPDHHDKSIFENFDFSARSRGAAMMFGDGPDFKQVFDCFSNICLHCEHRK